MSNQVRTITYKVQMQTQDGENKGRAFQTTLTGVSGSSKELQKNLENLGRKIAKETGQNFKILDNQTNGFKDTLKQLARESSKTERTLEQMTREYRTLAAGVNRTADEQEKLNAIMRLGKGATLSQKKEVVRLVSEYQRLRGATQSGTKSMRNFRGQLNNAGFQLQDIAVQAQAGTNAFVIFSQQGSQLAASLGKNGPLIGAGVALAGVLGSLLFPNITKNKDGFAELNEELKDLAQTTGLTKAQSLALIKAEENKIKLGDKEIKQMTEKLTKLEVLNQTFEQWKVAQESLANGNASTLNFVNPANAVNNYKKELRSAIDTSVELLAKIDTQKQKNEQATKAIELAKLALAGSTDEQKRNTEANQDLIDSLTEQVEVLGLSEIEIIQRTKRLALEELAQQNATKAQKQSVATMYDQIIAYQQANEELDKYEQFLSQLDAAESDRAKTLARLGDQTTLLANLSDQYKREQQLLGENHEAQLKLTEEYELNKLKITGSSLEKYMIKVEDNLANFDDLAVSSLENFSQGFGQAFANAAFESESLGDAMESIFVGVGKNMVAFFAEWAAQELILWTLRKTLGAASGASAAVAVNAEAQASSLQAGIHAFSSTAAIPVIGPALAPGAMGTALSITQPMAAVIGSLSTGFAGAYDRGGVIPQDMLGIVSEYGDELVNGVLVRGAQGGTRVTGREDTANIISGGGGSPVNITVNGTGNASPDMIANAIVRKLKRGRGNKQIDTALYNATERGRRNKGSR